MAEEFARTELLIGEEGLCRLREASVMVLGAGGVGSYCIEALARSGIGRLILVDNDKVAVTNINRQSIALHSTVGQYKTRVMKTKIADISPQTEVVTYELFILPENIDEIFQEKPDYIVDAVDTVTAKLAAAEKAREYGKVLYSREKPVRVSGREAQEKAGRRMVPGSISFVPPAAGLLIAGEVIREIAGIGE